ncbi:MAG: hypothetical protein ACLFQV_02900 [Vulcanimicrobiota bacterium]
MAVKCPYCKTKVKLFSNKVEPDLEGKTLCVSCKKEIKVRFSYFRLFLLGTLFFTPVFFVLASIHQPMVNKIISFLLGFFAILAVLNSFTVKKVKNKENEET